VEIIQLLDVGRELSLFIDYEFDLSLKVVVVGHGRSPCVALSTQSALASLAHSTVTDFAKFRGWSTSQPRRTAM
jgi:hypothetical protein